MLIKYSKVLNTDIRLYLGITVETYGSFGGSFNVLEMSFCNIEFHIKKKKHKRL